MSVIESTQTYVKTYPGLGANDPLYVNHLGIKVNEYGLMPLPGGGVVNTYINGTEIIDFPFALQSMESTLDDPARIANIAFMEDFTNWIKSQEDAGIYPILGSGETPLKIETFGWGFLIEDGESGTGVYQIECNLNYRKI